MAHSDEEDGGFMATIAKAKKAAEETEQDAENFWDDEFKSRKKKGKDKTEGPPEDNAPKDNDEEGNAENDAPQGVLSKKAKEKLKKEKEKAKKKAAAQAKKGGEAQNQQGEQKPEKSVAENENNNDDNDEPKLSAAAAKRKKKKAAAAAGVVSEEPPPQPKKEETDKGKKPPSKNVAALRALMEQKRAAEEEAKRKQEEEERRIKEEEERQAEKDRLAEEAKQKKREKEKAKKLQLKKEGKLLTPKQKAEQAAAKARLAAMVASGVKVEGLEKSNDDTPETAVKKKVTYGKKQQKSNTKSAQPTSAEQDKSSSKVSPADQQEKQAEDFKDDWDAESEPEKNAKDDDVKDEWDAESEAEKDATKDEWDAESEKEVSEQFSKLKVSDNKNHKANGDKKEMAKVQQAKAQKKDEQDDDEEGSEDEESSENDDSESDSEEDSDSEESVDHVSSNKKLIAQRKAEAAQRRAKRREEAVANRNKDDMRSPICCILGHVDTGKTKILDKIRQTNVQEGEAGGITQQIGATFFPMENIRKKTSVLEEKDLEEYKLPGLLVIDTPGHESFTNLRTRGSSLCNIAVLVVDIMHGLEPQTLESIRLLRDRKTPFIVALNKIDRLYGWKANPDSGFEKSIATQSNSVKQEFESRLKAATLAFNELGFNAVPYYENTNFSRNVSLVPTSAHTGEGIPDLLMLLIKLTQERMAERLMYLSELECTVLEVKVIEGLGTTIDVVLSNGVMREGDKIVVCGLNGAIVTQVRALLTPQPLKELRIKGQYVHHKEVKAALGVKIVAPELEKAIAGSRLLVVQEDDEEDELREEVMSDLVGLSDHVDKSGKGVWVQASTLGSLEALLEFLKQSKIPVFGISIGPVHKKDVVKAAIMMERAPEYGVMLCFDVPVDKDAYRHATEAGLKIFEANIIYHLFDEFTKHTAAILEAKQRDSAPKAVWPCRLKIIACFAKRDPIIVGCDILEGSIRIGTPLCVVKEHPETKKREVISLGKITSLEINHKSMDLVKKGQAGGGVAVKIEHAVYEPSRLFGRHFDEKDEIVSMISRESLDVLKSNFRDQITNDDVQLLGRLKKVLGVN